LSALLGWLDQRVIATGELREAADLALPPPEEGRRLDLAAYTPDRSYRHRFAEPFGALVALLSLDTLAELEASSYSYGLSLLVLLTATLALYAGYRMVAAVVSYSERRNDFVSAVSHELKTPLTAIRMYGEMLRDDVVPDPSKRNRYYRIITAESERLTRLINNVLELSKIERGQRPLSLIVGDVTGVAREVLEVLEPHAAEQGFELELEAEPDLPAVRFDRDALAQVLFNLVDNALKYASEAEPRRVLLRCERAGDGVAIRVADRGPGVARRHLRHIFKPFYRGERELTRRHKGTGIGLALVRGLVERMGGRVAGRNTDPGFEVCVTLGR
jgi:signal transduction histidine kinase